MEYGTQDHPECREGEVYLTNLSKGDNRKEVIPFLSYCFFSIRYADIGYATKRAGEIVYNRDGSILEGAFPVFVSKQEWDENEERLRKRNNQEEEDEEKKAVLL